MDHPSFECPICFHACRPVKLACGHKFCAACLRLQLVRDTRCAICRQGITGASPPLVSPFASNRRVWIPSGEHAKLEFEEFGVRCTPEGTVISGIHAGSFAHRVGLRSGDVVVAVNGVPCTSRVYATYIFSSPHAETLCVSVHRKPHFSLSNAFLVRWARSCCKNRQQSPQFVDET